jgi:hypothetical protein
MPNDVHLHRFRVSRTQDGHWCKAVRGELRVERRLDELFVRRGLQHRPTLPFDDALTALDIEERAARQCRELETSAAGTQHRDAILSASFRQQTETPASGESLSPADTPEGAIWSVDIRPSSCRSLLSLRRNCEVVAHAVLGGCGEGGERG